MKLEKVIEDGVPEEAPDLLSEVDEYPSWESKGRQGFIYMTRKRFSVGPHSRDLAVYPFSDWVVIFARKAMSAVVCEKMQLRPANRYTLGDMALKWAAGSRSIELHTKDRKMAGALTGDPSKPGRYRFTVFDSRGPVGHVEGTCPQDLLSQAWGDGFRVLCRGCVDEVVGGGV